MPDTLDLLEDPRSEPDTIPPCHAVEVRLDLLPADPFSTEIESAITACPLPVLVTARHPAEGGAGELAPHTRARMIRHHLPHAAAIDLELRSLLNEPDFPDLAIEAKSRGVAVIGSFHDFEATPDPSRLAEILETGTSANVDIIKIATRLRSPRDLANLISLFDASQKIPLAAMGMGPLGKISRLALAKCGSILAYGYLGSANVEGQWSAKKLTATLATL